jgi:D-sedoheptulose 7-phosphate isomerase
MSYAQWYLSTVADLANKVSTEQVQKVVDLLIDAYENGQRIFLFGNGGSASTASHIACDLQKSVGALVKKPFKALAVCDSIPIMTAWGNDTEYANIFAPQIATWAQPGDVVLAFSGSGNSPNVIRAVETAKELGAKTVGFAGYKGGKLKETAGFCIVVDCDNMQQIEDLHLVLGHLIFSMVRDTLTAREAAAK